MEIAVLRGMWEPRALGTSFEVRYRKNFLSSLENRFSRHARYLSSFIVPQEVSLRTTVSSIIRGTTVNEVND